MNFVFLCRSLLIVLIVFVISGCSTSSISSLNPQNIFVEKKIEYKREAVNNELLLFLKNLMKDLTYHDLALINKKYINPNFGFYNLYQIDGVKNFSYQKIIFNVIESETVEISNILELLEEKIKDFAIIQQDIKFDCSPTTDEFYGWNGEGLYLSDKTKTYLSDMMNEENKLQKNIYSKEEIEKANFIEKTGYKVIVTPELIFYVNKIEGKWYITLFDRITTDCSSKKIEIEKTNIQIEEKEKVKN